MVRLRAISGSIYFSKGKLFEIADKLKYSKSNTVFVNTQLSNLQQKNLEKYES